MGMARRKTWPVSALRHGWILCLSQWSDMICQRPARACLPDAQGHLRRFTRAAAVKTEGERSPYRMQVLLFVVTLGRVTRVASARCESGPLRRALQGHTWPSLAIGKMHLPRYVQPPCLSPLSCTSASSINRIYPHIALYRDTISH
jgi:hypothetical protein